MAFRKFYLYRTDDLKSYYTTSPAFAERFFSSKGEITSAVFCGEVMFPVKGLDRIVKGVYVLKGERREQD